MKISTRWMFYIYGYIVLVLVSAVVSMFFIGIASIMVPFALIMVLPMIQYAEDLEEEEMRGKRY